MNLSGQSIVGFRRGTSKDESFYAVNPVSGERLERSFSAASSDDLDHAAHRPQVSEVVGDASSQEVQLGALWTAAIHRRALLGP